ncbi:hypothetical protein GCM10011575_14590 [Microlunatus endophyticus]|uniref:Winged helix DNA-binding domain-containing protein n=1 Tax=Microlunatus endophyticus TaxID=1716077 RepID=A0A917S5I5_9ACTN|nr:hypothetical protein [Microlunatus endophyticus]GGL57299.1 hypothetical protein GCM10011575_14590 [Microlunatus endophyticus]
MPDREQGPWSHADAWILAATSSGRRGSTLSGLIGSADAINHDIPTRDQLASSLGALLQAGLIEHHDGRFRTTRPGKLIRKHWRGGLFNWSATLLPQLQQLPRAGVEWPLTEDEFRAAYEAYRRW